VIIATIERVSFPALLGCIGWSDVVLLRDSSFAGDYVPRKFIADTRTLRLYLRCLIFNENVA